MSFIDVTALAGQSTAAPNLAGRIMRTAEFMDDVVVKLVDKLPLLNVKGTVRFTRKNGGRARSWHRTEIFVDYFECCAGTIEVATGFGYDLEEWKIQNTEMPPWRIVFYSSTSLAALQDKCRQQFNICFDRSFPRSDKEKRENLEMIWVPFGKIFLNNPNSTPESAAINVYHFLTQLSIKGYE